MDEKLLFSAKEASSRLREKYGISHGVDYLRALRYRGDGPEYVLFRGRTYYRDEDLARYVASRASVHPHGGKSVSADASKAAE
jgi:hypothetical protein